MEDQDALNYTLGRYIAVGVNNPKKYPKRPVMSEEEKHGYAMTSDDQIDRYICAKFGG